MDEAAGVRRANGNIADSATNERRERPEEADELVMPEMLRRNPADFIYIRQSSIRLPGTKRTGSKKFPFWEQASVATLPRF